jgi:hypothetical protein
VLLLYFHGDGDGDDHTIFLAAPATTVVLEQFNSFEVLLVTLSRLKGAALAAILVVGGNSPA